MWEGRFKSQALLDESALLACMAYVDLKPIRASIAATPETSDYTSIKKRIDHHLTQEQPQPSALLPFYGYAKEVFDSEQPNIKGLPFRLMDYIELVNLTGRIAREDKRGAIDLSLAPILQRLKLTSRQWLTVTTEFEEHFHNAVGTEKSLTEHCKRLHKQRRPDLTQCQRYLS